MQTCLIVSCQCVSHTVGIVISTPESRAAHHPIQTDTHAEISQAFIG
jgi:hypothetical protein